MRKLVEGSVITLIGVAAIYGAYQVPSAGEGETWAGIVPMSVSICLFVLGLVLAFSDLKMLLQL